MHHLYLPELHGKRCCSTSHGWMVMVGDDPELCLLNPFTRAIIQLPSLTKFPNILDFREFLVDNEYLCLVRGGRKREYAVSKKTIRESFIVKAIISTNPSLSVDYTVMLILDTGISLRRRMMALEGRFWELVIFA
ncbi:hypothetical protein GIB67_028212 [Kingdonia uniflora]|uniref:KIB1-4 beta-propeller domain-containing protein n=1 Tax=Kingdonia uniflora TaxID=39325 RepID=A0A7J7KZ36_9MAGN|nr:hypothetical protein GIB67_028212 [Kingdonia uniflora]